MIIYFAITGIGGSMSSYEENYLKRTEAALNDLYMILPPDRIFMFKLIFSLVVGFVTYLYTKHFPKPVPYIATVVGALVGLFIPDIILHLMLQKRRKKFNQQMIEVMNTITNGLRSGFSFLQALQLAAERLPSPAGQEFRLTMREVQLGVNIEDALDNMDLRLDDEDLRIMIMATRLTMQTGGDLPHVYNQMTQTISERNRIEGKIRSLTAQGKMQATIVGLIPPAMFLIVKKVNPDIMKYMYTTLEGWIIIAIIIALDIIGYFLIRKIITIKF